MDRDDGQRNDEKVGEECHVVDCYLRSWSLSFLQLPLRPPLRVALQDPTRYRVRHRRRGKSGSVGQKGSWTRPVRALFATAAKSRIRIALLGRYFEQQCLLLYCLEGQLSVAYSV